MSRSSERMGRAFEKRINAQLDAFPVLFKVPTARTVRGRPTARTWLDYAGCTDSGRFLTFDAKWIGAKERVQRSVLAKHQREWADAALEVGAHVYVYVGAFYDGSVREHAVPWAELREVGSVALPPFEVESLAGVL